MQSSLGSFLWLMEPEESRWFFFLNVLHSRSKRLFFLLQKKFLALYLIAANLSPTPKTPVEVLLIFERFGRTSSLHLLFEEPEEEGRKGIRNKRMWVLPRAESRVSIV